MTRRSSIDHRLDQGLPTSSVWQRLLAFACLYTALHALYSWIPDPVLRDVVHFHGVVQPGAMVISFLAPGEHAVASVGAIESSATSLSIVRGCDGSGVLFLLMAAVISARTAIRPKFFGLVGAVALTYLLNEVRVIGLYFVAAHRPTWFEGLHNLFVPTYIVLASLLYFLWWSAWARRNATRSLYRHNISHPSQ